MYTGMTSRPIPSPGIRPIRRDLEAIDERMEELLGVCGGQNFSCQAKKLKDTA